MPKKNDDIVGQADGPPVNGGRQTSQQANLVEQDGGGLSDVERSRMNPGRPDKANPALGGSSGGHSDQVASRGPAENRKVAGGLSQSERTKGMGDAIKEPRHLPS